MAFHAQSVLRLACEHTGRERWTMYIKVVADLDRQALTGWLADNGTAAHSSFKKAHCA